MLLTLRTVGAVSLLILIACALTPLPNAAARLLAPAKTTDRADAIVVLAADVREDGTLGDASLRRAVVGIAKFHANAAPVIVFTGASRAGALPESIVRSRLAEQFGVPEHAVLSVGQALTTRDEARRVKLILEPRKAKSVLLVTDSLHLRRAKYVFEREGFRVRLAAADTVALDAGNPEDRLKLTRAVAQQTVALIVYRLADWLRR